MNNNVNDQENSSSKDNTISDYLLIGNQFYAIPEIEQKIANLEEDVKNTKNQIRNKEDELIFFENKFKGRFYKTAI